MNLVTLFSLNDHTGTDKADAGDDALDDPAGSLKHVAAAPRLQNRHDEGSGAEGDKAKRPDADVSVMVESVEPYRGSNRRSRQ
jgi:hypothetical protein